jgi:Phospholipase_D-nuclease N-terminal
MKFLLEVLLSIFLHPVAFVLCLINLVGRNDINSLQKLIWGVVCVVWGVGPILYVMVGGGELW